MRKKKDAIQQDVSDEEVPAEEQEVEDEAEEEAEEEQRGEVSERERIASKYYENLERADELDVDMERLGRIIEREEEEKQLKSLETPKEGEDGEEEAEEVEEEESPAEEEDAGEEVEQEEAKPKEQEKKFLQIDDDALYHVKIDGEEQTISGREMKARSQKGISADKRLEEATRLLREATELREANERARAEKKESGQKKDDTPAEDVPDDVLDKLLDAIQMGDNEEGKKALRQFVKLGRGASTPATPAVDVQKVVDEKLRERDQLSIREKFLMSPDEGGFLDLVPKEDGGTGDHVTIAAVNAEVNRLIHVEKKPDVWATYKQAGLTTRERLFPKKDAHQEEEQEDPAKKKKEAVEKKVERKRKLASIKPASSAVKTPDAEEEEESASQIIAKMRKERGQDL